MGFSSAIKSSLNQLRHSFSPIQKKMKKMMMMMKKTRKKKRKKTRKKKRKKTRKKKRKKTRKKNKKKNNKKKKKKITRLRRIGDVASSGIESEIRYHLMLRDVPSNSFTGTFHRPSRPLHSAQWSGWIWNRFSQTNYLPINYTVFLRVPILLNGNAISSPGEMIPCVIVCVFLMAC